MTTLGNKELSSLYIAACLISASVATKGTPQGLEHGGVKHLRKAIEKMKEEIDRRVSEHVFDSE